MAIEVDKNLKNQVAEDANGHLKASAKRTYTLQQQCHIENDQIMQLIPMVHKIVQKVVTYLRPPLTYEDLVSAGTVGLVKAGHDYDPSQQAEFATYAYIRIRGAVLDELRGWSFVPANIDKQIRETIQVTAEITEKTGSAPSDEELAEKLNITIEKLYKTFQNARAKNFLSIDNSTEDSHALSNFLASAKTTTPDQQLERRELVGKLTKAIQQLSERQRQVILLYYQQELTMKQIAEVFKITEPRVSQLHANAIFNLSLKLRQFKNGR
ncbi:sigma-70 family RNA polymerase sigma factor [Planctomycetota bacterium]